MAFYPEAQPAAAAFHHPDSAYAMNPYAHHEQTHLAAAPPPNGVPVYPYVDASAQAQLYQRPSYGDVASASVSNGVDHNVWQAPQAPRLTAAAARAGRQHSMGYAPAGYGQTHPWYAQSLVPQPYPQPRTHQQLEHQLLVQHHLAKVHERQNCAHVYQPAFGSASLSYPQQQHPPSHPQNHFHHHNNTFQQQPHAYQTASFADHDTRSDRYARYHDGWSSSHRGERASDAPQNGWSAWHHAAAAAAHREQMVATQPNASHRHSIDAAAHNAAAWAPSHNVAAAQQHGWDQSTHYAQHSYVDNHHADTDYRGSAARRGSGYDYPDHMSRFVHPHDRSHEYAEHHRRDGPHNYAQARHGQRTAWQERADESRNRTEATHWQTQPEARHDLPDETVANVAEVHDSIPAEEAAEQAAAPAPCSPGSLEKSALPIAAIGAQLIWNACAALFDPELLIEAHDTADEAMEEDVDDAMSPTAASMPSSSSTPSLNTPDISPWSSTVLDRSSANSASSNEWNAFRSPFGPERLPQLRPQAHSFTFGSDQSSTHHDLHRMAVGAERARSTLVRDASPTKRSRQGSGYSEVTAGHSSSASTASSSEPGTPASLAHESPALSSTVSANSIETTRSPLRAGLGMSLDGSRSESAIRSRRNSSKTSPTLGSSKWSGRIRDNVLAVLRLVSPDWRWSNNDHLFVSLSETLPTASAKASNAHSQGRSGGRDSVTSIVTSYANEPSPAFRRFVHQVLAQTLLSPPAFLLGILNALRLLVMAQLPDGSIDPVVLELFAQPTSAAPFKLFTLGMMIANKHLDDNTFLNKTWNEVTGIPLAELNQTEAWFLKKCNYEVSVPDETWIGFLNRLQSWEEKRSSRGMHRDQDSSKRLLLVLDEALSHFDAIPALQLDGGIAHDMMRTKSASPMDMWARPHHHHAGSLALGADVDDAQLCHSAPAMATFPSHDSTHAAPHRSGHVARASVAMENSSATLLRSSSDFAFKDISPLSESGKSQSGTMSGPLMPSALLNGSRSLFHHGSMFGPLATSG
ncbi:hypothetical protein PHSY_007498 [Pseudozyma hubeiensis SY62]|uniref:Cyclin N-terminal domain-containing protein n=1 Tax=Pseudozyma hubeiensis (strain SY62) TaxID=1305764 RepID=R9PP72_PSEHS|nr:hypothetical protein PHSY_007498 [Pseudozyma hubeiensis SY62]GAC99895.1 hypothetical protein PHSY_007498 [Pseudozyma hubeiensis SY62]